MPRRPLPVPHARFGNGFRCWDGFFLGIKKPACGRHFVCSLTFEDVNKPYINQWCRADISSLSREFGRLKPGPKCGSECGFGER